MPGSAIAPTGRRGQTPDSRKRVAGRLGWATLAVVLVAWPLFNDNRFILTMGTLVAFSAIGASSLNLIIRTGHVSLAHAAFMGVGAYGCVLSQMRLGLSFPVGLLIGCLASGLLALILGPIMLRLTGKYFVLVTFLVGEIIRMVFVEWGSLTGGSNGIQGIPPIHKVFDSPIAFYYLALGSAGICVGIVLRILSSEIGRAIDSVREAERVAQCSGVPAIQLKVTMFVIACVLVGVQGALQAHFLKFVDPTAFNIDVSLNLVVMNVIGGMYHLFGPLLGSTFIVSLPELLRGYVELQRVFFGVILIVVMAALPAGMVGALAWIRRILASAVLAKKR
jgi:branched-chain amino acid transport system permease protein